MRESCVDCDVDNSINCATFKAGVEIMLHPTILKKYPMGGVSVVIAMDNDSFHRRVPLGQIRRVRCATHVFARELSRFQPHRDNVRVGRI